MNKRITLLCLTLIGMTTAPVLYAQETGQKADAESLETEKYGPLEHRDFSPEERRAMHKKFRQHRGKMAEGMLKELDTNEDELVDLNEFLTHAETRFNELDADKDGFVTKDEARAHHRELRMKHHQMRKKMRMEGSDDPQGEEL